MHPAAVAKQLAISNMHSVAVPNPHSTEISDPHPAAIANALSNALEQIPQIATKSPQGYNLLVGHLSYKYVYPSKILIAP